MENVNIAQDIASLPPEAQRQVKDFIAFLKERYPTAQPTQLVRRTERTELVNEPFVGMWRDRKDTLESTVWVRKMRQREWESGA